MKISKQIKKKRYGQKYQEKLLFRLLFLRITDSHDLKVAIVPHFFLSALKRPPQSFFFPSSREEHFLISNQAFS
jgi:hypothetical protein